MLLFKLTSFNLGIFLINHSQIVTVLTIVVVFFAVLLLLGVRKSYKLKKENERLDALNNKNEDEDDENKKYKDFTEGHMYGGDN
ncbi:MAG: hypothetical protein HKO01_03190 [Flaviramulus sp.]|nr:hypothetical protein [Flaviramulus sp.]NNC49520.1 hypothetical protein [Flaviramulus sp.]